jgi:prophage maintenance system killer protein
VIARALESALKRPQSGYYNDVIQEAVALWESLSRNHPSGDGKRVAVAVTAAFLKVNGYRLEFDDVEAFSFLVGLYETGRLRFKKLVAPTCGTVQPTSLTVHWRRHSWWRGRRKLCFPGSQFALSPLCDAT